MPKAKTVWICNECGHNQSKWSGSCPSCGEWNTFAEEALVEEKQVRFESRSSGAKPKLIRDVNTDTFVRHKTGFAELDELLGGGLVVGSLSLLGGEPGIGKSTLTLQLCDRLAKQGLTVLYICGEESAEQTTLRARRLGIDSDRLYLFSETLFSNIKGQVDALKPDILIVDSVQIVYKGDISSAPGSVTQVREIAMECMHLAKGQGITTVLIGHVTKSGEIAGPRVLEHIVDTVFEFEGDRQHGYRILRSIKNRFGPTDNVALFQMEQKGLIEVTNPSETLLQERVSNTPGSAIIPTIEGSRAMLVEVQALVAPSSFPTSSRRGTGVDQKRLALLLAVLEKRMGYTLHSLDVFVSVAGGIKIDEPAIDLGIILAIASSFCNRIINPTTVLLGEVGLGGEVRTVPRIEARLKEAIGMGFTKCLLSTRNIKGLPKSLTQKIALHGISRVEEAIHLLLK